MNFQIEKQDKNVFKNVISAFIIKGLALVISFLSMPAYIRYFDNDLALGLWFTILSILSWVLTFDFGIGNGLRNHLVKPLENQDENGIKSLISSAYIILGKLTLIISAIIAIIILILNWNNILNVPKEVVDPLFLRYILTINFSSIIFQFFLRIISSIIYALQKSSINNLIALITSASQLLFVLILPSLDIKSNLIMLSLIHLITTIFPLIIVSIIIFNKDLKGMQPSRKYYNKDNAKLVITDGSKIFINQIFYMLLTGTNAFLITYFIGNEEVVEYQQYYRIYMLIGMLYMLVLTPIWSAVTKAKVNNDFKWIKKYFKILLLGILLVIIGQLIIIVMNQFIFNIWLGDSSPKVNYVYSVIFSIYGIIFTFQSTLSTFAMGFNKTKIQALTYGVGLILKFLMIISFIEIYNHWSYIVLLDTIVFIPYILLEYITLNRYINSELMHI